MKKICFFCAIALTIVFSALTAHADGIILPVDSFIIGTVAAQITASPLPDQVPGADGYDWQNASAYNVSAVQNGNAVTPSQALPFILPAPAGADAAHCAVFYLNGSSFELCSSVLSGSARKVTSSAMGLYVVASLLPPTGDLTGDWVVDSADRMLLSRYLAGWNVPEPALSVADINRDGSLTALDRAILARYLAHWSGYDAYFE